MFLRATTRKKDGKEHRYWSIVENRRLAGGRVRQRHVLYLGEINSSQERAWRKSVEVFDERAGDAGTVALFPEDRSDEGVVDGAVVRLRLSQLQVHRPRVWGSCWLTLKLWQTLALDQFWSARLPRNRKGTRWDQVLFVLVAYRLLSPGSEWKLHRQWYERSALTDLLGADDGLADIHKLYACHDLLLAHKRAMFDHLVPRWRDLFNVEFDVLLYDLTSTYFESSPLFDEDDKRRYGYSRDHRSDCVQVVIALVVTPDGLPLAYEVLPGNTADSPTLRGFPDRIEHQYGKARRVWVMDRGIPTEETLAQMRQPIRRCITWSARPRAGCRNWRRICCSSPGRRSVPACRSSCCRRMARCMCSRRASTASPRSGRCANANSRSCGHACSSCHR